MGNDIHKQFVQLGRERNRITYKLLALLSKIHEAKIYKIHGYATIYEYAGFSINFSKIFGERWWK